MNNTDNEKLSFLKKGSLDAFESLYDFYSGKLYNFVLRLSSGDTYLAEEIVQRTFIKIWETRKSINPEKSFISYLCTIAKNMLMNEYQHQTIKFIYQEYAKIHFPKSTSSTEHEVNKNLLEEYIENLTKQLPPARQRIFIMSRKEMLSNKEIAEKLDLSESTVQTQLSKALIFMKEQLSKYYDNLLFLLLLFSVK